MTAFIHIAASNNPHETLALEEVMLNHIAPGQIILYLYVHQPSVIIGRTQNAWAECHHTQLIEDGGILARRISGGGAVYHDPQNLNFSFIAANDVYDVGRQLGIILDAVRGFGIDAEFSGRNDIVAEGRKFSGNAFCTRAQGSFHHGTLMIDTDTEKLQKYLNVSPDKMQSKGVKSVRSRVMNLRDAAPALTQEKMMDALKHAFVKEYGHAVPYVTGPEAKDELRTLSQRNATWDWLFGKTPEFSFRMRDRFSWGGIEIGWQLKNGVVEDVQVFSDSMAESLILKLAPSLRQSDFSVPSLQQAISPLATSEEEQRIVRDLQRLFDQSLR